MRHYNEHYKMSAVTWLQYDSIMIVLITKGDMNGLIYG